MPTITADLVWTERIERLRKHVLEWCEVNDRTQSNLARHLRCHPSKISRLVTGEWKPSRARSLGFVERLEQRLLSRDDRVLPSASPSASLGIEIPEDATEAEEERLLEDLVVRNDYERQNHVLDQFGGAVALGLVDELYKRAVDAPPAYAARMQGNFVRFYAHAFSHLHDTQTWDGVSSRRVDQALRRLLRLERSALRNLTGDEPCGVERVRNYTGISLALCGLALGRSNLALPRATSLHAEGITRLVETAGPPAPEEDDSVATEQGTVSIRAFLLDNCLNIVDKSLAAGFPGSEVAADRATAVALGWPSTVLREVLADRNLTALKERWRSGAVAELVEVER